MPELIIPEFRVPTDRLRIGVFIRLDGLKWYDHPFLFKSFKITSTSQLRTLQAIGVKEVVCIPSKSDVLPLAEAPQAPSDQEKADCKSAVDELWRVKQERTIRLKERKERIAQCEKRHTTAQEWVNKILHGITGGNLRSVKDTADFAEHFAAYFLKSSETALQLMRLASTDEGIYYHSMNVTVLAMMLGREVGITAEEMKILCQGALMHDIGKSRIDRKVLVKEKGLTKPELDFLRLHPKYGVEILAPADTFPRVGLMIVYQHHEASDGSGYPKGITGEQIHLLSKLVTIANVYDNHCNKRAAADCLTPYEALSSMFTRQKAALDEKLLTTFIRCLGIYPPGTIVQLNNGSVGMVISVNPTDQLRPSLVLYDSEIPKKDALIIDMEDEPDLKISKSLRPADLPQEIFDYLSPRSRVTYFVDTEPEPGAKQPSP